MNDDMISIFLPCNIGDLTQKKVEALKTKLFEKYRNGVILDDGLVISDNRTSITFKSDVINYNTKDFDYKKNIFDFNGISKEIGLIIDALMIDEIFKTGMIKFTSIISTKIDIMDFSNIRIPKIIGETMGCGLRYFFMYDSRLCEFKIEPLINDTHNLYIEGIYNFVELPMSKVLALLEKVNTNYIDKKERVLSYID